MSNPFVEIGKGIKFVAEKFAAGVVHLFGLAHKVEYILKSEKPLEKPFIDGLSKVVTDIETLLTDAQVAVTDSGINFPADSAAYAAFIALYADARALLPIVEDQLAVIEGKPLPHPLPAANDSPAPAPATPAPADSTAQQAAPASKPLHEQTPA